MANLMHIAETAVLLFVAYQVGWFVAFIARRLLSAQSKPAAVAAERLAKAKGELAEAAAVTATPAAPAPASVLATTPLADPPPVPAPATAAAAEAAPVAPPRPRPPLTPVAAAPTPPPAVPTLAETAPEASFLNVLEADDDEPSVAPPKLPDAPVGGEDALAAVRDAIGISVVASSPQAVELAEPVVPPPAPYETPVQVDKASPEQPLAVYEAAGVVPEDDVIAIDAPVEVQAEPVAAPSEDAFPAAPEPIVPVATEDVEFVFQADPGRTPEAAIVEADAEPEPPPPPRQLKPASRPGEAWSGPPVSSSPAISASAVETALDSPAPAAAPATAAVAAAIAEAEAMRAIEGGWTRRPSTRPAEAAARSGPGPVAQAAPTRPPALLEPREGGKDDLRLIEGLRPADEAALNALGIFHFDQIAQWNRPAIDWLELHQIGAGRVTGERWVEQAQMLTSIANSARAVGS